MRYLPTAICLALCSQSTLAADFGIGVSAKSDDAWIYAPIAISDKFRIEPSVRYGSTETASRLVSVGGSSYQEDGFKQETETLEVGIGAFGLTKITDSTRVYYGARVSYVDTEIKTRESLPFRPSGSLTYRSRASQDGYRIGPAIGFEYLFGQHLSIGGEANYTFLDLDGEARASSENLSSTSSITKVEQKGSGTGTQLIIRYQF